MSSQGRNGVITVVIVVLFAFAQCGVRYYEGNSTLASIREQVVHMCRKTADEELTSPSCREMVEKQHRHESCGQVWTLQEACWAGGGRYDTFSLSDAKKRVYYACIMRGVPHISDPHFEHVPSEWR